MANEVKIFDAGDGKIFIHPYEHNAKYYETDQMGIIHHSNYIRWMEEARMDMMEQMGFGYDKMEELEIISPVISVNCFGRSPAKPTPNGFVPCVWGMPGHFSAAAFPYRKPVSPPDSVRCPVFCLRSSENVI